MAGTIEPSHFKIVQPMFDELSRIIQGSVAGNFQIIMQLVSPLFGAAVILYSVFVAWEIMYTRKDDVMMEAVKNIGVFTLVFTLMTAGGMYLSNIVPFVQGSGQEIAAKIIGGDGASTGATIDALINQLIDIGKYQYLEFKSADGITDTIVAALTLAVKSVVLLISGSGFVVVCAAYLLMAEMMVGILLSIGGVFIGFAAFPSTRNMFTAWVGSCLNYIFLNIAYACLFKVLTDYIMKYVNENNSSLISNIWGVVSVALVFIIGKFLLAQISTLVSTLTGGVGINGLTSATGDFIKGMSSKTGMNYLGGKAREMTGKQLGKAGNAAKEGMRNMWGSMTGGGNIKGG
ncbi:type IV secretion system protein [Salmonella enterica subsp. enterica serovar Newport]|nr:type IV secretion system protein [Salmonella enterica subsp. enterica serovar Newport]